MADGCTGQCCVAFPLTVERDRLPASLVEMLEPITPEEATARHERLYGGWGVCVPTGGPSDGQYYRDSPGYGGGATCEYGCDCTDRRPDV